MRGAAVSVNGLEAFLRKCEIRSLPPGREGVGSQNIHDATRSHLVVFFDTVIQRIHHDRESDTGRQFRRIAVQEMQDRDRSLWSSWLTKKWLGVECKVCNARHAFASPKAEPKVGTPAVPRPKAALASTKQGPGPGEHWGTGGRRQPLTYTMERKLQVGDVIDHPTFGLGYVQKFDGSRARPDPVQGRRSQHGAAERASNTSRCWVQCYAAWKGRLPGFVPASKMIHSSFFRS